jgi:hypothetical protein
MAFGHRSGVCRNVLIEDVVIDGARRNGVSVVSVSNFKMRNCVVRNSNGVAPEEGIDIELHNNEEIAQDIVIEDCIIEDNNAAGIAFFFAGISKLQTRGARDRELEKPIAGKRSDGRVRITVDSCVIRNNGKSGIRCGQVRPDCWGENDWIVVRNTKVINNGHREFDVSKGNASLYLLSWSADGPSLTFDNCRFEGSGGYPIHIIKHQNYVSSSGNILFRNGCTFVDNEDRPFLFAEMRTRDESIPFVVENITGEINIINPYANGCSIELDSNGAENLSVKVNCRHQH